jgi:hypothetical protein
MTYGRGSGFEGHCLSIRCALSLTIASWTLWGCGSGFSAGPTGDAGRPETSSDAGMGTGDSGGPTDAPSHWCTGRSDLFCEDFDESNDITEFLNSTTWSTYSETLGTFAFDTATNPPSPPNSLSVVAMSNAQALVIHTFPKIALLKTTLRLEFDLRVDQADQIAFGSAAAIAALAFGKELTAPVVTVALSSGPKLEAAWGPGMGGPATDAGSGGFEEATKNFSPTGAWAGRYALEIAYGTPGERGGCAQVYVGAAPQLPSCLPLPPLFDKPSTLSIALGVYSLGVLGSGSTGTMKIEFDDVTFNAD